MTTPHVASASSSTIDTIAVYFSIPMLIDAALTTVGNYAVAAFGSGMATPTVTGVTALGADPALGSQSVLLQMSGPLSIPDYVNGKYYTVAAAGVKSNDTSSAIGAPTQVNLITPYADAFVMSSGLVLTPELYATTLEALEIGGCTPLAFTITRLSPLAIRVTFTEPVFDNAALRNIDNYVLTPPGGVPEPLVLTVIPEAVSMPIYVDLLLTEQKNLAEYTLEIVAVEKVGD